MLTGFPDDELSKPLAEKTEGNTDPHEIPKAPIYPIAKPGDVAYVWHAGLSAGEMTGRSIHAIELNLACVDVSIMRWHDFTGHAATLESDGRTFDERAGTATEKDA